MDAHLEDCIEILDPGPIVPSPFVGRDLRPRRTMIVAVFVTGQVGSHDDLFRARPAVPPVLVDGILDLPRPGPHGKLEERLDALDTVPYRIPGLFVPERAHQCGRPVARGADDHRPEIALRQRRQEEGHVFRG